MMRSRLRSLIGRMMLIFLLAAGLAAPAVAEPARPIADVKALAGQWRAVGGASAAAIRIEADGSYQGTAASGVKTTGKIAVTAGKASYRSTGSEGTVTLAREGGRDVLTFMLRDRRGSARLERVK